MKNNLSMQISSYMLKLAEQWFTTSSMLQNATAYIKEKEKENLFFGQLVLCHYYMFEGQAEEERIFKAAAAIELAVLATDILDDIQDQDAPHKIWMKSPEPVALHIATSMLTLSQQGLLESANGPLVQAELALLMNKQLLQAANGQMSDILNESADEDDYLEMVRAKSASLLVLASMAGVLLAGKPWNERVAQYASDLGIAAQLRNDLRDLLRWDDKSDFLQRKRSLLTMYLLEDEQEELQWIRDYYEDKLTVNDIADKREQFEEICHQSGAVLYGSVMSRKYYESFKEIIDEVNVDDYWRNQLLKLVNE
ncbi:MULTISPECIES: polyprenyl synthetase family protein [unclassified Paenibacillus]|uniref:polyprenyl synthetase family protein n=1 Tax=unclassified Paenibacillus TaxID=185978 RepID=UPI002F41DCA1